MNDNVRHLPNHWSAVPPRDERDWVTSVELVAEAGITYRQCDYWVRTDLLSVLDETLPGSGHLRRHDASEVARARAIADLLTAGVSLQTIREVLDRIVADGQVDVGHITFTYHPEGAA